MYRAYNYKTRKCDKKIKLSPEAKQMLIDIATKYTKLDENNTIRLYIQVDFEQGNMSNEEYKDLLECDGPITLKYLKLKEVEPYNVYSLEGGVITEINDKDLYCQILKADKRHWQIARWGKSIDIAPEDVLALKDNEYEVTAYYTQITSYLTSRY